MYYTKKKKPKKEVLFPKEPKRKSLSSAIRKLDGVFSEYIRLRDSRPYGYKYFKCISCGRVLPYEDADCGHFIGRTHMSTRFDEKNCSAECRHCNRFGSDHIIYYERNLVQRYGKEAVDMLIARGRASKKWTAWELDILTRHYKEEIKKMKSERDGT